MTLRGEKGDLEIVGNGEGDEFEVEMGRDIERTVRGCGETSMGIIELEVTKFEVLEPEEDNVNVGEAGKGGMESDVKGKRRTPTDIMKSNPTTPKSHLSKNKSKNNSNTSTTSQNPSIPSISSSSTETKTIIPSIYQVESAKTIIKTVMGTILITPRPDSRSSIAYSNTSDTSKTISTHSRNSRIHDEGGDKFEDHEGDLKDLREEVLREGIESKVEWSMRMKRYQKEELQYLGLDLISPKLTPPYSKPTTPPPPPPSPPSSLIPSSITPSIKAIDPDKPTPQLSQAKKTSIPLPENNLMEPSPRFGQGRRLHKSAKLSKERFEIWLNGLSPGKTSTGSPVIEPQTGTAVSRTSTLANEEVAGVELEKGDLENGGEELDGNGEREKDIINRLEGCKECCRSYETDKEPEEQRWVGEMVTSSVFKTVEGTKMRDWGVQTDLTGCLIVF